MRHVDYSHNSDPRRRLGDKCRCKEQFGQPSTAPFLKQQPFSPENQRKKILGNAPKTFLGGENYLPQRTPEDKPVSLPQNLYNYMAEDPNANAVEKKTALFHFRRNLSGILQADHPWPSMTPWFSGWKRRDRLWGLSLFDGFCHGFYLGNLGSWSPKQPILSGCLVKQPFFM